MRPALHALLILLTLAWPTAQADRVLPEKFDATYTLTLGPLTLAKMTRKLYPTADGNFIYESHSKAIGYARWFTKSVLVERSEWRYDKQQLQPLTYTYDRTGEADRERHVKLIFDWAKLEVINVINSDPWKMEIKEGTQDKLVYQLALINDLLLGKRTGLKYSVADGGSIKDTEFEILGEERIRTSLGEFDTLKLKTQGSRRTTTLWCAKALAYIPVLIEQSNRGREAQLKLTSLTGIPIPTPN